MTTPEERSVEEIDENILDITTEEWAVDICIEQDIVVGEKNRKDPVERLKKRLYTTLQTERQRCEEVVEEKQLEFALQQLTGWCECRYGTGNITDLVTSMGLTLHEWKLLEKRREVDWVQDDTKKEILEALTQPNNHN